MYPPSINTPRLYAMIFGFFSLTAIFVVAQASMKLTNDADKTIYLAQAAEEMAPLTSSTSGTGSGDTTTATPTLAPLPTFTSPPPVESNNQPNNQPNNQVPMTPVRTQPNSQQNNQQNNFKSDKGFNNQQGMSQPNEMNQSNDMMGQDGEQNDEQDQGPQFDAEGIKNGVQAARGGFDKFVSEFKNVGPLIKEFKAAKRVAGTVKQKQAVEKLCPLIDSLLTQAKDLQNKLAAASMDVAEGYSAMAAALDVATHVMALEAVVLEESGDTVTIDTGEEETVVVSGCQAADDLRGTIKMMNGALPQMTKFTAQAVREINKNKKILYTIEKKADQLDNMKDPSIMFKLFGQAEQSAQKVLNMTNDFLSRIVNGLEQLN